MLELAVSKWDSDLMDSQRKLGDIAGDVRRIQVAQNELDTNLDTIFAYQMELKSTLEVRGCCCCLVWSGL
jgi:nuclear pore complex protein Nup62